MLLGGARDEAEYVMRAKPREKRGGLHSPRFGSTDAQEEVGTGETQSILRGQKVRSKQCWRLGETRRPVALKRVSRRALSVDCD